MRGGDIRRVVIHGAALHGQDVMDIYHRLADDHPSVGGRAVRIQSMFRGFIMRKKRDAEIKKNKGETEKDEEGEEKTKEGDDEDDKSSEEEE